MIDFRDAMEQRALRITEDNPDRIVRVEEYSNGSWNWGILTIMDGARNIRRFEFFETEDSWRRPNVVNEYNIGANQGYSVYVILPDSAYREFMDTVGSSPDARFDVSTYGRCQIPVRIPA